MSEVVMLNSVRLAFAVLWTAESFQGGEGEKRFSASFPIDPKSANVALIETAIQKAAKEKWKDKSGAILKKLKADGRMCYFRAEKTSAEGEVYDGFEGMYSLAAANKARPLILDRDKTQLTEEDGKPYSGCYVDALVEIWAQDNRWGKRINAALKAVRFREDGDAFGDGGSKASSDDFDDLADTGEAESASEDDEDSLF